MAHRIALVDDDRNILTSVSMALEAEGFDVTAFHEGAAALAHIHATPPDLVVLDVKMPGMDGIEVLKKIRAESQVPVVFLTSKDEETDQFLGLRMGADDYITKPFSQRLLIERIRVILRRDALRRQPAHAVENTDTGLMLDTGRHLCHWNGARIDMTVTEFLLLKILAQKPGHVKTRDQLMDYAYGDDVYVDDRTVDSHIKRIRRKFREADPGFDRIETVYGVGYRFKEA